MSDCLKDTPAGFLMVWANDAFTIKNSVHCWLLELIVLVGLSVSQWCMSTGANISAIDSAAAY
jgi:hypothetical protein